MRQLLARSILLSAFAARRGRRRSTRPTEGAGGSHALGTKEGEAHIARASAPVAPPAYAAGATSAGIGATRLSTHAAAICAVALFAGALLALYWRTTASIVAIWIRSETFAHGFVVVPIALWLAWRRRDSLAQIPLKPWWPALAGVAGAGALWLVASAADALGVKQFALVFMIQAGIVTIVGRKLARALFFPLAFLLFAVPAGEIFVPTLIDWTADFTVSALRWSGIPIYREANHFIIPSGAWSVVEACSGIRYIIASVMVGTIYAAVAYRSAGRRAAFLAASILVPIVANWLRAYMIVMLAHLSSNKIAVGVDHLIYGWVFFGLVMLLLFWVGSFWREDDPTDSAPSHRSAHIPARAASDADLRRLFGAALAGLVVAGVWLPIESVVARPASTAVPVLPAVAGEGGWTPSEKRLTAWNPHYTGFASAVDQTFQKDDRVVGLYVAYFRNQEKGRELVTSGNVLVTKLDWNWRELETGKDQVDWGGARVPVHRAEIAGRDLQLEVYRLYWINGALTSSDYAAKAMIAWSKLRGRGDDSALILMYTRQTAPGKDMGGLLRDFASIMSAPIERALSKAQGIAP